MDNQVKILNQLETLKVRGLEKYNLMQILFTVVFAPGNVDYGLKQILMNLCFRRYQFSINENQKKMLFVSYDYSRSDHNGMIQKYKELYNCDVMELSSKSRREVGIKKSLANIPLSVVQFCRIYNDLKIDVNKSLKRRLACSLLDAMRFKNDLEKCDFTYKAMLQYFDGGLYENVLTQFCKLRGMKTITLQHGQPVFHGKENDLLNQTMMLNFSSDYVLVTGAFSKKQFMLAGVPESKIKVCGSLRDIKKLVWDKYGKFIVLLDCPTYEIAIKSNQVLIEAAKKIAVKYKFTFVVKCHPQDEPSNYVDCIGVNGIILEKGINITDALVDMDFALLHVSGAYLDAMAAGVKSFCLVDEFDFPLVEEENDKFNDEFDLESKVDWWIGCDYSAKQQYFNRNLEYYLSPNNARKRNQEFVEEILNCE